MAELSTIADWTLRTLTGMPGTSPIAHIDLIRAVIGEPRPGHDVLTELLDAGHAVRLDATHYQLEVVTQPASDDLTGYGTLVMWHAIRAAQADRTIQPGGWRLGIVYDHAAQTFNSPAEAVRWFRDNETRLIQMLDGARQYGFYDVACELAEPIWALSRYIGHNNIEVLTQLATISALESFDDEKQELRRATALARAACGLSSMGLHEEAIANADSAVLRAAEVDDPLMLSIAHSVRGRAHQFTADLTTALTEYETSLAIAERIDDPRSIALRHRRIASVHAKLGNTASAITHLRTAEKLMTEIGDTVGRARVLTCLGRALLVDGQHAEAHAVIMPTFEVLKTAANDLYLAEAAAVAGAAAEHADLAQARAHYILALAKFDAYGLSERAADIQRQLDQLNHR